MNFDFNFGFFCGIWATIIAYFSGRYVQDVIEAYRDYKQKLAALKREFEKETK